MNKDFRAEDVGRETNFHNIELTEAQQQKSGTGTKKRRKDSEHTINTGHSTGQNHGLTKQGSYSLHSILALGRFSLQTLGHSSGEGTHFKRLLNRKRGPGTIEKVILKRINLEGNTHAQEINVSQLPV
jgi:hypothetical protein